MTMEDSKLNDPIITVKINKADETVEVQVPKSSYVFAKWKDLLEYGYVKLTQEEVSSSVDLILSCKKPITFIDHFVQGDIVIKK